jgi:hypothetical protein
METGLAAAKRSFSRQGEVTVWYKCRLFHSAEANNYDKFLISPIDIGYTFDNPHCTNFCHKTPEME